MTSGKSYEKTVQEIPQHGFFGHPEELDVLFFIEFWERLGYYGTRAMLIFYMYFALRGSGFGMDKTTAISIMSVYGSLIYMSPIPGDWVADRITSTRGATLVGAILIIIGHACLSLPFTMVGLFTSMFFIIVGSGLMEPDISNVVGRPYPENDVRMDAGLVIFYMSMNIGVLVSPAISQYCTDIRNFHGGFLIAAIGVTLGLIWCLLFSRKTLGSIGMRSTNPLSSSEKKEYGTIVGVVVIAVVLILMIAYFMHTLSFNSISNTILILSIALPIIYFTIMIRGKGVTDTEGSRVEVFIPSFILGMLFWSIREQGSSVLNTYNIENSDMRLNLFGWKTHFGEAIFQTINPLSTLLFAPAVILLWQKLGKKRPSLPTKFVAGITLAGASYIPMGAIGHTYGDAQLSVNWVILLYVICVIGEFCLSPTGSSAVVKLVPKAFNTQVMSLWLLTNASAQTINGTLIKLIKPLGQTNYFIFLGVVATVVTLITLAFTPKISEVMKGIC